MCSDHRMTKTARPPIPLRPDYGDRSSFISRAMSAALNAGVSRNSNSIAMARRMFPDDRVTEAILTRAVVGAASTSVSGWAAELANSALIAFLSSLGPDSAAAELIKRGLAVNLPIGVNVAKYPKRNTAPVKMPWVGESSPIPVRASDLALVECGPPKKFGTIVTISRETAKRSNARAVFEQMLREEASLSLDAAYFSSDAGTSDGLAGLLYGLTSLESETGARRGDLVQLAKAVGAGGSGQVVFIAGTGRAAALGIAEPELKSPVLPSAAVPEDRLIAVDPASLIHLADSQPQIAAGEESIVHSDDDPDHISTAGTPNVVAAPVRSLFQTDCIAVRLTADLAFGARRAGAVAYMDGVEW